MIIENGCNYAPVSKPSHFQYIYDIIFIFLFSILKIQFVLDFNV